MNENYEIFELATGGPSPSFFVKYQGEWYGFDKRLFATFDINLTELCHSFVSEDGPAYVAAQPEELVKACGSADPEPSFTLKLDKDTGEVTEMEDK